MTKILQNLLVFGAFAAMPAMAQQDNIQPQIQWVAAQDAVGVEISEEIVKSHDNNVFILNKYESSAKTSDIMKNYSLTADFWTYNMADGAKTSMKTCTGVPDVESANGSPNMTLYKVDKNGKLLWTVCTNIGDFAGGGVMAATPDNGVILFLKMRHSSRGHYRPDVLCQFVDDAGMETAVKWQCPDSKIYGWVYQPVLAKISAEGKVEWAKRIPVEYKTAVVNGETVIYSNNFEARGAKCDEEGNIYLGGSYRTSINFGDKAYLQHPRNVEGWDGDSQKVRGDLYVVKLNPEGEALWSAVTAGDPIECESMVDMAYADGMLYLTGYMQGDAKNTVKVGNSDLVPVDHNSLFVAALSATEGKFVWGKIYNIIKNSVSSSPRCKPMCIVTDEENIYLGGSLTGTIINGLDSTDVVLPCEDKKLNAYIMKADRKDGTIKNATKIGPSISEVQSIHVTDHNVLASAYNLSTSSFLYDFDKNLSDTSLKQHVIKSCPMGTTLGSVLIDDTLISVTRGKNSIIIPGVDWKITPLVYDGQNNWICLFTGHKIEGLTTGITDVEIGSDQSKPQVIYDLTGRRVTKAEKGLYIINGKKVFVR